MLSSNPEAGIKKEGLWRFNPLAKASQNTPHPVTRTHDVNHPLGISLNGFLAFIEAHGGREAFEGKSTDWVKRVVMAATQAKKTSWAAQLKLEGSHFVAPATAFISHAYDDEFLGVVDAIAALEKKEGKAQENKEGKAFYYFDLLIVNQHSQGEVVPFEVLRDEFANSVRAIGRTLLILRWADPIPLKRAWCVFEVGTTLAVGATIRVLTPPSDVAAFKSALAHDFDSLTGKTCHVDVEQAGARMPSDLENIRRVIVEGGGYLRTNQLVIQAMKGWMVEEGYAALQAMRKDERGTSSLISNLATLLRDQDRLGEAEPLFQEALTASRQSLGDESPVTLVAISNFASLLAAQGKLQEAEPLCREVVATSRRAQGDEHPTTLAAVTNLADVLRQRGATGEALPLYQEGLRGCRKVLGDHHTSTLLAMVGLANVLDETKEWGEAEALYREALGAYRELYGEGHPDTQVATYNLAELLNKRGQKEEAVTLFRREYEVARRVHGEDHQSTLQSARNLKLLLGQKSP